MINARVKSKNRCFKILLKKRFKKDTKLFFNIPINRRTRIWYYERSIKKSSQNVRLRMVWPKIATTKNAWKLPMNIKVYKMQEDVLVDEKPTFDRCSFDTKLIIFIIFVVWWGREVGCCICWFFLFFAYKKKSLRKYSDTKNAN